MHADLHTFRRTYATLAKGVVESVGQKPDLPHAGRINPGIRTLERNQSHSLTNVELQHITTIIECFIAVRRPNQRRESPSHSEA